MDLAVFEAFFVVGGVVYFVDDVDGDEGDDEGYYYGYDVLVFEEV